MKRYTITDLEAYEEEVDRILQSHWYSTAYRHLDDIIGLSESNYYRSRMQWRVGKSTYKVLKRYGADLSLFVSDE